MHRQRLAGRGEEILFRIRTSPGGGIVTLFGGRVALVTVERAAELFALEEASQDFAAIHPGLLEPFGLYCLLWRDQFGEPASDHRAQRVLDHGKVVLVADLHGLPQPGSQGPASYGGGFFAKPGDLGPPGGRPHFRFQGEQLVPHPLFFGVRPLEHLGNLVGHLHLGREFVEFPLVSL